MLRLLLPLLFAAAVFGAERPNVLLIVADDLGYRDVGFQGARDIPTPHLDRLAAEGVRCTQGYVTHAFCSPTRAGLLTGRYQHRFGHENNPAWRPESTTEGLPVDQRTIADYLQQAGYHTGLVGKWHLGAHPQFHPNRRGFQDAFSALGGGHQYFPGDKGGAEYTIPLDRNGRTAAHTQYLTAQFGDEAAAFVRRRAEARGQPWFLYLAFNAPHTPLQAPPEWLAKVAHVADPNRRTYAAMIAALDGAVGRVRAELARSGQAENTLTFFFSDNGGPDLTGRALGKFTDNSPLRGAKGQLYEGGIRVPFLVHWPARLKPSTHDRPVSSLDVLPTVLAAAGAAPPAGGVLDGVDLLPVLEGRKSGPAPGPLFWRTQGPGGNYAVRRDRWKLVRLGANAAELYDLGSDLGESRNVAADHPEIVRELVAALGEWEKGTLPPVFEGLKAAGKKKASGKGKAKAKAAP